jgi:hypothetical protein
MSNVIYQNDRYVVRAEPELPFVHDGDTYTGCYTITNLSTGILEYKTPALPEALTLAVQMDVALEQESHLWPYGPEPAAVEKPGDTGPRMN